MFTLKPFKICAKHHIHAIHHHDEEGTLKPHNRPATPPLALAEAPSSPPRVAFSAAAEVRGGRSLRCTGCFFFVVSHAFFAPPIGLFRITPISDRERTATAGEAEAAATAST
jgi:hypothetical protein